MGKDDIAKAEKKARKEQKKKLAEADAPVVAIDSALVGKEDVEMRDATNVVVVEKSSKKEKDAEVAVVSVEELSPIAHPLAGKKLNKKVHKVIKKSSKLRQAKRGVKEIVKAIRKGEKGILILAGDINPMDIISHLPIMAEEAQIPYIFVASKEELGRASSTKRPTSCVFVCPDSKIKKRKTKEGVEEKKEEDDDYRELYDEIFKEIQGLNDAIEY